MFKSIKTNVLALILVGTALLAQAQKKIAEGTITYGVKYELPDDKKQFESMLPTEVKPTFSGDLVKVELSQGPATISNIVNIKAKQALLLIDVPVAQKQMAVKMTPEDIEKARAANPKFTDFKEGTEKKVVAGYNAVKYTFKDEKGASYEMWVTNDIDIPANMYSAPFKDIKGVPVEFVAYQQGIKMLMTMKSLVEGKVAPIAMDVPKGYEEMTMDQLMQMSGGGQ